MQFLGLYHSGHTIPAVFSTPEHADSKKASPKHYRNSLMRLLRLSMPQLIADRSGLWNRAPRAANDLEVTRVIVQPNAGPAEII